MLRSTPDCLQSKKRDDISRVKNVHLTEELLQGKRVRSHWGFKIDQS